jgi:hypothetical protein
MSSLHSYKEDVGNCVHCDGLNIAQYVILLCIILRISNKERVILGKHVAYVDEVRYGYNILVEKKRDRGRLVNLAGWKIIALMKCIPY